MEGYVYIMTNRYNKVLYTGMTGHLKDRVLNHKIKKYHKSFSARYNLNKLVYYEKLDSIEEAYKRERQLKGGSRQKKIDLINSMNPEWKDLYDTL